MKIIFALGNPGSKYAKTRHNVGFWLLDAYAKHTQAFFQTKPKFFAEVAEITHQDEKILLMKPSTYYNDVGRSARAVAQFYKLTATDFLVIHDDLALPIGTLRTRIGGSGAGNNGIKSLNAHLGDQTSRLRVGSFNEKKASDNLSNVLSSFTLAEKRTLKAQLPASFSIIEDFIKGSFEETTYR